MGLSSCRVRSLHTNFFWKLFRNWNTWLWWPSLVLKHTGQQWHHTRCLFKAYSWQLTTIRLSWRGLIAALCSQREKYHNGSTIQPSVYSIIKCIPSPKIFYHFFFMPKQWFSPTCLFRFFLYAVNVIKINVVLYCIALALRNTKLSHCCSSFATRK